MTTNTQNKTIRLSSPLLKVLRDGNKAAQSIQSTYNNALQLLVEAEEDTINYDSNAFTQAFDEIRTKYTVENGKDNKGNTKYKINEEGNSMASKLRMNMRRSAKELELDVNYTVKHTAKRGSYVESVEWPEVKTTPELVKMVKKFVASPDDNLMNDIVLAMEYIMLTQEESEPNTASKGLDDMVKSNMDKARAKQAA